MVGIIFPPAWFRDNLVCQKTEWVVLEGGGGCANLSSPPPPLSYGPNNADEFPVFREITQLENEENRLAFHNCLIKNSLITDEVSSENK